MHKKQNDIQYLESLFREHYSSVYKLIANRLYHALKTYADADDFTQEVFIIAGKRINVLRKHPNPAGWLMLTAQYVVNNHVRTKSRQNTRLFHSLDLQRSEDDFSAIDLDVSLQNILSPEDYAILHAYCIENRPHDEICAKYNLSEAALRVRISRLKKYISHFFILFVTFFLCRYI